MAFEKRWLSKLLLMIGQLSISIGLGGCDQRAETENAPPVSRDILQKIEPLIETKGPSDQDHGAVVRVWKSGKIVWAARVARRHQAKTLVIEAIAKSRGKSGETGVILLCLPRDMNIDLEGLRGQERSRKGLLGAKLGSHKDFRWLCPHEITARNQELDFIVDQFALKKMNPADPLDFVGEKWAFDEVVISMDAKNNWQVNPILRGKRIVLPGDVTRESTQITADLLASWMFRSVQKDGRMLYKWEPSLGREGTGNNMIRQFMATVSLVRWGMSIPPKRPCKTRSSLI